MTDKKEQIEKYINHLIDSTIEMLNMMFAVEAVVCDQNELSPDEIFLSSVIPFGDEHFKGQMGIRTSEETAYELIKIMLGWEDEHIDRDTVFDGMGELANIAAGQLKTIYPFLNIGFDIGIPNIVYGLGHGIEMFKAKYTSHAHIKTDYGILQLFVFMS